MPQTPYSIQTVRNLPEVRELKNVRCLSSLIWLEKFLDKRNYELIQIDTDSLDLWLSWDSLEEAVFPAMTKEFRACKKRTERARAGTFHAGVRGHLRNRAVQQVLFHGGREKKGESVPEGKLKAPKQNALGAVQSRAGGGRRHRQPQTEEWEWTKWRCAPISKKH